MPKHHHVDTVVELEGLPRLRSVAARIAAESPSAPAEAEIVVAHWTGFDPKVRAKVIAGADAAGPDGPAFAWQRTGGGVAFRVVSRVGPDYALAIRALRVDGEPVAYVHSFQTVV